MGLDWKDTILGKKEQIWDDTLYYRLQYLAEVLLTNSI